MLNNLTLSTAMFTFGAKDLRISHLSTKNKNITSLIEFDFKSLDLIITLLTITSCMIIQRLNYLSLLLISV